MDILQYPTNVNKFHKFECYDYAYSRIKGFNLFQVDKY